MNWSDQEKARFVLINMAAWGEELAKKMVVMFKFRLKTQFAIG